MVPLDIAMIAVITLLLFLLYLGIRNVHVLEYRLKLIGQITEVAMKEITIGVFDYNWRYEWYEKVSYERMLLSFQSLDSFYPDKDEVLKMRTK